MQRPTVVAVIAVLLLAIASFFIWQHFTRLGDQVGDLSRQIESLGAKVVAAEERATAAEARAEEAEDRASEAAGQAESAAARERESARQAREASAAREAAEERQRLAAMARREAEEQARLALSERLAAEARQVAAEKQQAEEQRKAEAARDAAQRAREETLEVRRRLEAELDRLQRALGRIADTRRTALGLVMTLDSSQIEFDFDKADLRPGNREVLSRIAGVLLTFQNFGIQIFGHTDDVGSVAYNQKLSEQRAASVRDYLVEAGIDAAALSTRGLGKSSPLVDGSDAVSRQRNRRVELAMAPIVE